MKNIKPIVYKVPKGNISFNEDFTSMIIGKSRSRRAGADLVSPLVESSIAVLELRRVYSTVFYINQNGLRNREHSRATKSKFKNILEKFREFLVLPNPFTGKIEFHCDKHILKTVKFYPQ